MLSRLYPLAKGFKCALACENGDFNGSQPEKVTNGSSHLREEAIGFLLEGLRAIASGLEDVRSKQRTGYALYSPRRMVIQ